MASKRKPHTPARFLIRHMRLVPESLVGEAYCLRTIEMDAPTARMALARATTLLTPTHTVEYLEARPLSTKACAPGAAVRP